MRFDNREGMPEIAGKASSRPNRCPGQAGACRAASRSSLLDRGSGSDKRLGIGSGELTPSEAAELGKLVEAHVKAIEATEFQQRLEMLEAVHQGRQR